MPANGRPIVKKVSQGKNSAIINRISISSFKNGYSNSSLVRSCSDSDGVRPALCRFEWNLTSYAVTNAAECERDGWSKGIGGQMLELGHAQVKNIIVSLRIFVSCIWLLAKEHRTSVFSTIAASSARHSGVMLVGRKFSQPDQRQIAISSLKNCRIFYTVADVLTSPLATCGADGYPGHPS